MKPAAEQCPSCKAYLAADQRYCLACGTRCGEPRLPFMDAVTFMDAMKATPEAALATATPTKHPPRRASSSMALFATIGVLLIAMGVGVLIGRSGNGTTSAPVAAAPQVIKVGGAGEESATTAGSGANTATTGAKKATKKNLKEQANTQEGANEFLHTDPSVKLADPKVELGDKCEEGVAGCEGGKFTGDFFSAE